MKRNFSLSPQPGIYSLKNLNKPLSIKEKKELIRDYNPTNYIDSLYLSIFDSFRNPYKSVPHDSVSYSQLGKGHRKL